jgi:hypothetical protein
MQQLSTYPSLGPPGRPMADQYDAVGADCADYGVVHKPLSSASDAVEGP